MWTATFIRRHIFRLPVDKPFTTRDCLIYGVRSAVDQTLYRLVKTGIIRRLARGIFVRDEKKYFSEFEIAALKAAAFGHKIMRHEYVIPSEQHACTTTIEPKLFINSRSSRFCVDGKAVTLHGIAHRKMQLDEGKVGQVLKALWKMGEEKVNREMIVALRFNRADRQDMVHYIKWLPSWLSDLFIIPDRWPFPQKSRVPVEIAQPKILVRLL